MKTISKLLMGLAAVSFVAVSCLKEAEFEPGEPDAEGCYGVFFPSQDLSAAFEPSDTDYDISVKVSRTNDKDAITVPVVIEGEGAQYITLDPVFFKEGQAETTVNGKISCAIEAGAEYEASISITDTQYVSEYSSNPSYVRFTFVVEKWNYLGKAEFWDLWLAGSLSESGYMVDLYQNASNTDLYRLVEPYKELWEDVGSAYTAGGWALTEPTGKIEFQVMRAGQCIHEGVSGFETEITSDGAIYYDPIKMGLNNPYYGADVYAYNPVDFSSLAGDESNLAWNKVANWQSDGLPSVAYLAGYRYMPGIGGWGGYDSPDEAIVVRFPGGVFVDYTFNVEIGASVEGVAPIQFTTGPDVTKVLYAVYEGELTSKEIRTKKASIVAGEEAAAQSLDLSTGAVDFSAETTGMYTLVAVAFDKDDVEQNNLSTTFGYVKAGDEEQVAIQAGCSLNQLTDAYKLAGYSASSSLLINVYGKDIKSGKVGVFTIEDFEADEDGELWSMLYDFEEDEIEKINEVGGYTAVWSGLKANTDYVMLVTLFNGYQSNNYAVSCMTPGLPREKVAEGKYYYTFYWTGDDNYNLMYDPNTELYVIEGWGAGVDFTFAWDKETNLCPVQDSYIGSSYGSYGAVYCVDASKYWKGYEEVARNKGYDPTPSYYASDTQTFNFNLEYYVSAGTFGDGWETFVLDSGSQITSLGPSKDSKEVACNASNLKLYNFKSNVKVPFKPAKPYTEVECERTVKAANCTVTRAERKPRAEILMSKPIMKAE